jgi:O-antigen/teichoic acid export membrane protein
VFLPDCSDIGKLSVKSSVYRLLNSSLFRILSLLLQVGIGFYMMPFLVSHLGDHLYGYWTLIATILGYYYYLDLGIMVAVQRQIAYHLDDGEEKVNEVFNSALVLFLAIGGGTLLLMVMVYAVVMVFNLGVHSAVGQERLGYIILLLGFGLAISFPAKAFQGLLSARIRHDQVNKAMMVKFLLNSGCIIWAITSGYGLMSLFLITIAGNSVEHILMIVFAMNDYPGLRIRLSLYSRDVARQLFNYGLKSFVSQMADLLRSKGGEFVIAIYVSPAMLTHYVVGGRLVEYFSQMIQQAVGVVTPHFSRLDGQNDSLAIRSVLADALCISTALSLYIGGSMLLFGDGFIALWMGPQFRDSYVVLSILTLAYSVNLSLFPNTCLLFGTARHHIYAIVNTIEALVGICLVLILVRNNGIYGVAVAVSMEMVFFKLLVLPVAVCRVFQIPCRTYYGVFLLPTVVKMALFFIPCALLFHGRGTSYVNIVLLGAIQTCCFLVYFVLVVLPAERKDQIILSLKKYIMLKYAK